MSLDKTPSNQELLQRGYDAAVASGDKWRAEEALDVARNLGLTLRIGPALIVNRIGEVTAPLAQPPAWRSIDLVVPWTALISDNLKFTAYLRGEKPAIKITKAYAEAKARIARLATDRMAGLPPADRPLALLARVWYPNNAHRDLTNWCKLVHDALNKVVYADDGLLHDVRWTRAGVDIDHPRAEIVLTLLSGAPF